MKVGDLVKRIDSSSYGLLLKEGQDRYSADLAEVWWLGYKGRKADNPHWVVKSLLEKL